jgi:hypothetical protein
VVLQGSNGLIDLSRPPVASSMEADGKSLDTPFH